jgi:hypothetical protein
MGCTIDHLRADHHVTVLRDFRDARGNEHRAGEQGMLRLMELDWPRQEFFLEWEREGVRERMCFSLSAKEGPRNGAMRDFFALGEAERVVRRPKPPPPPPAVTPALLTEPGDYDAAVARIWALAARCRFDEAEEQVRVLVKDCGPFGERTERAASDLGALAARFVAEEDRTLYLWLRERSLRFWYAWGSQATSGGEGAVRGREIRAAERHFAELEAKAAQAGSMVPPSPTPEHDGPGYDG